MKKEEIAKRKSEGWLFIGFWLDPEDVKNLKSAKESTGIDATSDLIRHILKFFKVKGK